MALGGTADPLTQLPGVGPRVAEKLARLGLERVEDLLFHLPLRYEDRTRVHPLGSLVPGSRVMVEGTIEQSAVIPGRRSRSLVAVLSDGTGQITLRLFRFYPNQQRSLRRGARVRCYGEVRPGFKGLELVHPEFRVVREGEPVEETLTPIYPATEGLGQSTLRRLIGLALERFQAGGAPDLLTGVDHLPDWPDMGQCLNLVHRPTPDADLDALGNGTHACQQRLAFEELLAHRLSLRLSRSRVRSQPAAALPRDAEPIQRFIDALPFKLTSAQQRVIGELSADLDSACPAMRLIQGDVGSGKTAVAGAAIVQAVAAGRQAAMTAPTELLAEQHLRTLGGWLEPMGIRLTWLSGRIRGRQREDALAAIASEADVVVGTHALMQEGVEYRDLALVVVDEQHRFGVHQRMALRDKGASAEQLPHQLIMTATPIPRTLAMTAYADLDVSVIDELPPGRTPVSTVAMSTARRDQVEARVAAACRAGRQAYWVCTLIEESEALEAEAAEAASDRLSERFPKLTVGLVHGRLKAEQKERTMAAFAEGGIDLLVATTVIEVGVDVPNASLMIIENAERLGLSQLHQLRGRVGRGAAESSCVLLYQPPLSGMARERLALMRETSDGFAIAQRDLELRGPGEVLGTRQTGSVAFRIADLARDRDLLDTISEVAEYMLAEQPVQAANLIARWIGDAESYAGV